MSHKQSLGTQTGKIWCVIRKNKAIDISLFNIFLSKYCNEFAYIVHEKDVVPITAEVEGIHYHLVCNLKDEYKDCRLSTTLNRLVETLELDNGIGIQIEKYSTFEGCLQYLTHKNNPEKTQHNPKEIVHNLSQEDFDLFYNVDLSNKLNFDTLYSSCLSHSNKLEVIREYWGYYSKSSTYMRLIDTIWDLTHKGVHI